MFFSVLGVSLITLIVLVLVAILARITLGD
jgi:hypothetical protein